MSFRKLLNKSATVERNTTSVSDDGTTSSLWATVPYSGSIDSSQKIYIKIVWIPPAGPIDDSPSGYFVYVYDDSDLTSLICSGSRTGDGSIALAEANDSGISGTVTIAYSADDSDIYAYYSDGWTIVNDGASQLSSLSLTGYVWTVPCALQPVNGKSSADVVGVTLGAQMKMYLPHSTDIRPENSGGVPDRVTIDDNVYTVVYVEDMAGRGRFKKAYLRLTT